MAMIHRAHLQSKDAANTIAGMLMRPQRHQRPQLGKYQGKPQARPMDDTPNCWALSPLQHLDKLDMEITLSTQALTPESIPLTHNITDHLVNKTTDQQRQVKMIGIAHVEDLASPIDRNWTPMAYAQPKLQFTKDIIRPPAYNLPTNIRSMMTFQHQGNDQQIQQILLAIANPRRYSYKVSEENGTKLSIPVREFDPHNNKEYYYDQEVNMTQQH